MENVFVDFSEFGAIAIVRRADCIGVVSVQNAPVVLLRDGTKIPIPLPGLTSVAKLIEHIQGKPAITQ